MKVVIKTLGCKVNQAESARITSRLKEQGHDMVHDLGDHADVCIINTCTVTAKSDYQSRQLIRRAVKTGAKVIATGCYAQLQPDELTKIKGLDMILGNEQKDSIHEYLAEVCTKSHDNTAALISIGSIGSSDDAPNPEPGVYVSGRARAFLKIQDGCDFSCSYCAVPMARGKSRSLSQERVLAEGKKLVETGYKEIVITGIHIGLYGLDLSPESSLLDIARKVAADNPSTRFRLSSIEPQEFQMGFLHMMKSGNICRHVHIPLQSGSDSVLKAMKRRYTALFFKDLINNIARECPDISIGTDVIAGFPGESVRDFENTRKLLESLPISYMHVFPYSRRPGTQAAAMKGQITGDIVKERAGILREIATNKKKAYMKKQLGRTLNVLVEKKESTSGFYRAISDNYIRPLVKADGLEAGQIVQVTACSLTSEELICEPLHVCC